MYTIKELQKQFDEMKCYPIIETEEHIYHIIYNDKTVGTSQVSIKWDEFFHLDSHFEALSEKIMELELLEESYPDINIVWDDDIQEFINLDTKEVIK